MDPRVRAGEQGRVEPASRDLSHPANTLCLRDLVREASLNSLEVMLRHQNVQFATVAAHLASETRTPVGEKVVQTLCGVQR